MFWIMLKIMGFGILISTKEERKGERKGEREKGNFIDVAFFVHVFILMFYVYWDSVS